MTKEHMVELAQSQLEAYNRRDLNAFCANFHPEVKVRALTSETLTCDNLEKFREIYKGLFDSSPNLNCELKDRIVLDSAVIDHEWVTGAAKYPNGVVAVAIYGYRDNLIDRVWFPR